MKVILFFFILLSIHSESLAQKTTIGDYNEQVLSCFKGYSEDSSVFEHMEDCMDNYKFPFFCVEDIERNSLCSDNFNESYILNFWFVGCDRCVVEKKFLERLSLEFPFLKIISFSRDEPKSFDTISEKMNWICVAEYENKGIPNNMVGYPLTILLNEERKVRLFLMGGVVDENRYNKISSLIK